MTAARAEQPAGPGRSPFANASPAQIRAALTPADAASFDQQWRSLMAQATERLDLADVHAALDAWRDVAWVTSAHGHDTYTAALAHAEARLRTGERAPGSVPWHQLAADLGLPD